MSKFSTHIPVNIEAVTESLPEGSHIHRLRISDDKKSVVLDWENDHWRTPFTFHLEVSPEALAGNEPLPDTVRTPGKAAEESAECKRVQNQEVAPPATPKAKRKRATPNSEPSPEPGNQAGS